MADSQSSNVPTQRFQRGATATERLAEVNFPLAVRGYDRKAVDDFLDELEGLVRELESRQTREGVVQRALDEVGEETAGILQRAHETADEIATRSRVQADGRLERAEREAEIARRDADQYSQQVVVDTRLLWDERQRLIEDIRSLADEVLATADDAMERVKLPDALAVGEDETEPTTAEEPYPLGTVAAAPPVDDEAIVEEQPGDLTEPYSLEPVDDDAVAPDEESGHTVELEALPGGGEEPPEREPQPGRDEPPRP